MFLVTKIELSDGQRKRWVAPARSGVVLDLHEAQECRLVVLSRRGEYKVKDFFPQVNDERGEWGLLVLARRPRVWVYARGVVEPMGEGVPALDDEQRRALVHDLLISLLQALGFRGGRRVVRYKTLGFIYLPVDFASRLRRAGVRKVRRALKICLKAYKTGGGALLPNGGMLTHKEVSRLLFYLVLWLGRQFDATEGSVIR